MQPIKRQSGVVLIFSLIMLAVLTLLGTTAVRTTSLEERMAGNSLKRTRAFQSAEAAIRVAEDCLQKRPEPDNPDPECELRDFATGQTGLFAATDPAVPALTRRLTDFNSRAAYSSAETLDYVDIPRHYIRQHTRVYDDPNRPMSINNYGESELSGVDAYQIVAEGSVNEREARVLLRSHHGVEFYDY